jgi:hypothetical protein
VLGPDGTVKGHPEGFVDHHPAEGFNPFAVEGELVVIEIDVPDIKTVMEVFQVLIEILGGIVTETAPKYRTVAVTAGIRASAARYTA